MKIRIFTLVLGTILLFVLPSCRKERPEPPTIEARNIKEFSPSVTDTVTLYDNLYMLFKRDSVCYYYYKYQKEVFGEVEKGIRPVGVFRGWRKEFNRHYFVFHLSEKADKCYTILCCDENGNVTQTWLQEPFNKQEIVNIVERDNWRKYACYVDIYVLYVIQNGFKFYPLYYDKDVKVPHE